MSSEPTVFVVDDDELARKSVCALVQSMSLPAESFASAEQLLAAIDASRTGCVVTDLRMLGMGGLQLLKELKRRDVMLPVVVITGFAKTALTVQAIQEGAVTLLEKPCDDQQLWDAISEALRRDDQQRQEQQQKRSLQARFDELTDEEWAVLRSILEGKSNKVIARDMDVSTRTIESRRHNIHQKTGTGAVAELVMLVMDAGVQRGAA